MRTVLYTIVVLAVSAFSGLQAHPATIIDDAIAARESFTTGMKAFDSGDFAAAIERYTTATKLVPDWALAHLQLGIARFTLDPNDAQAIVSLEQAVALDPTNARSHLHLGVAYLQAKRHVDSIRELKMALEQRPDLIDALAALAAALADTGATDEAIAMYYRLLDRSPGHVGALLGLADCYERQGVIERAEAAWLTITRLYANVVYYRYRLAEFYARVGLFAKANQVFAEIEEIDPRQRKMRKLR